ncbi:MAG TPA: carboxypeptidase-like regulatory domain-containing protein, partial [Candidatus Acidoferrales bacterium]|nr:carboxypeptidase-like regulatory domain-containing protein [Candidatus Acidoferrales bacterium]
MQRAGRWWFGTASVGLVCLLFVFAAEPAPAQVLYGSVVGSVKDSSGGAIPTASVTAVSEQTRLTRKVVSDAAGNYTISTLPAGTYDVSVTAQGFKTYVKTAVPIIINGVARVDATLEVGTVTQTVEVMAGAQLLQTDRADVHTDL